MRHARRPDEVDQCVGCRPGAGAHGRRRRREKDESAAGRKHDAVLRGALAAFALHACDMRWVHYSPCALSATQRSAARFGTPLSRKLSGGSVITRGA